MNHSVHSCISGCLTLKFSGSWKTVICSSSLYSFFAAAPLGGEFSSFGPSAPPFRALGPLVPFAGEMGMVSRGTGEEGFAEPLVAGVSRVAILSGR